MNKRLLRLSLAALVAILPACSTTQIATREIQRSDPASVALLAASQQAQGGSAFGKIRDVSVRYTGRWAPIGPALQPVLSDRSFRRDSEERLLLAPRIMAQEHFGPKGKKFVVRERDGIRVAYNGTPSTDAEVRLAAALVADAYTMFLLGPFYFNRPGIVLVPDGDAKVDQAVCKRVLAVLRPGFGNSQEDRVILFIDRATKRLRRVRMTLNGLASTQGAEVDVTYRDFRKIEGVWWATDFDERIRAPLDLHAHHWKMRGLDLNRGLREADFQMTGFSGPAAESARPLPAQ